MPHIHELYDFTITVFIVYQDTVLLVHHPRYDKWIPVGGHIELNEDPEQALHREIHEETGLSVTLLSKKPSVESLGSKFLPTPAYLDVHEANPPHKHISLTYFARATNNHAQLSEEHSKMKWFNENELDDTEYALSPAVKFYCREALKVAKA